MGVCHYLFWIESNKITAILNHGKSFEIIKFGGNKSIEYKEDFWETWQEYSGFLKDDFIDFCFVFDIRCPKLPDYLKARECSENNCIWDKYMIQNALNILEKAYPVQVYNENDMCIAKIGSFRNIVKSDILKFKAIYRNSKKEIMEEVKEKDFKITPFIENQLKKLKMYDGKE